MGIAGNKGGVGIRFRFYESDLCFVNSHFASGDGQTHRRNEDYQTIESRMGFTDGPVYSIKDYFWYTPSSLDSNLPNAKPASATNQWFVIERNSGRNVSFNSDCLFRWKISDHDIVFWCGDLNYRISQPNEQVRKALSELSTVPLHEKDQLRCEMQLDHVFCNYYEPPIEFMPTYKFDIHTDLYDTSEKSRTPSWTDRVLYRAKRTKVKSKNETELETIQTVRYSSASNIKFSDHRPVSGLYLVAIKHECDQKVSSRIREELIRESDRMENDSIPIIEVYPRPPEIIFNHIRYLDRPNYPLLIKNTGECPCVCTIVPTAISESFQSLTFTPSPPYSIAMKDEERVNISFNSRQYRKKISEILILHVENGADTFITLDVTCDPGPFGLALDKYPPTLYDREKKEYVYSTKEKDVSEKIVEMQNDPPTLFIALIDCLKERQDIDLLSIFSSDAQDSLDLIPLRDQIYENNYQFTSYSSAQLLMILIHLLQALPEPLISVRIQDQIFTNQQLNISRPEDMSKAVGTLVEQLTAKERSLFFRLLLLLQSCWPKLEQIEKNDDDDAGDIANVCIDVLALSMLHEHVDRNQRRAFLLACLNEEKNKH